MTTFRYYRPGDEDAIVRLFSRVFGREATPEGWRWKLLGRPGPPERVILAEEDGEIVFHVGGVPCAGLLGGGDATLMVAVDAMTHPGHRGRGLLTEGYRRLFAHWREHGVDLVLGLPNERHGLRTPERGWRPLFPLGWRVRLLRPERVLARRTGLRWLGRASLAGRLWNRWWRRGGPARGLELVDGVPEEAELDRLWALRRPTITHGLVRDADWMRWRYVAPPGTDYRLLAARREGALEGVACWRLREEDGRRTAFLGEMLVAPGRPGAEEALVRGLVERAAAEGAELVAGLALEGSARSEALARNGFLRAWGSFQVACVPLREGLTAEALRSPAGWTLDGGAFDVV